MSVSRDGNFIYWDLGLSVFIPYYVKGVGGLILQRKLSLAFIAFSRLPSSFAALLLDFAALLQSITVVLIAQTLFTDCQYQIRAQETRNKEK